MKRLGLLLALGLVCMGHAAPAPATPPVTEQAIVYPSGVLQIHARVFWPDGPGPFPTVIWNHGGDTGLSEDTRARCRELAQAGFVVFASSYRGEDGSDGQVEIAKGEVDDALTGLAWVERDPRVDRERVAVAGTSHGALVSLLAAARTNQFRALVFAYGVADIGSWYAYLKASRQLGADQTTRDVYGGGPQDRPESFRVRDGLTAVPKLPASMPVLILQGGKDTLVPPSQAQALVGALKRLRHPVTLQVYPHSPHGFLVKRADEAAASKARGAASVRAFAEMVTFLKTALGEPQRQASPP